MAKKIKAKKANIKEINQSEFLTLLCAGQKITEPSNMKLHSGTIKIFNAYHEKGIKFDNCKGKNRDKIFDGFGSAVQFKGIKAELKRVESSGGAIYRTIAFLCNVKKED